MSAFNILAHNGSLMLRAESIINGFLDSETEDHKVFCYLVNPDGTRVAIQKGFKLENYEYVICNSCKKAEKGVRENEID